MNDTHIIGIDPGTKILGYCHIIIVGKNVQLKSFGNISLKDIGDMRDKLAFVYSFLDDFSKVIRQEKEEKIVIATEKQFLGKNFNSAILLSMLRGTLMLCSSINNFDYFEDEPVRIKKNVIGRGDADKEAIKKYIEFVFPDIDIVEYDESDSILIALACALSRINC